MNRQLFGHVMKRALIIHWLNWERATGHERPMSATMEFVTRFGQLWRSAGGLTGLQTPPRQQSPWLGVEKNASAAPMLRRSPLQSRIVLPASSQPCEVLVLHFCSPNAGHLRRAAAELMHLTKYYLATGISAFTPETLW
jgi:hypothetical protein